jgi:hypothetical protein
MIIVITIIAIVIIAVGAFYYIKKSKNASTTQPSSQTPLPYIAPIALRPSNLLHSSNPTINNLYDQFTSNDCNDFNSTNGSVCHGITKALVSNCSANPGTATNGICSDANMTNYTNIHVKTGLSFVDGAIIPPVQTITQPIQPMQTITQPMQTITQPMQTITQPVQPMQTITQPVQTITQPVQPMQTITQPVQPMQPRPITPSIAPISNSVAQPALTPAPITQPQQISAPIIQPQQIPPVSASSAIKPTPVSRALRPSHVLQSSNSTINNLYNQYISNNCNAFNSTTDSVCHGITKALMTSCITNPGLASNSICSNRNMTNYSQVYSKTGSSFVDGAGIPPK